MALLKEDGSLDVDFIDSLPIDEHIRMLESLTDEQIKEYFDKQPINESKNFPRCVVVDYTLEEDIERNGIVNADDIINRFKKKYGERK